MRLESLVQKVVSPYLGTHGLYSGDGSEAQCCVLGEWERSRVLETPVGNKIAAGFDVQIYISEGNLIFCSPFRNELVN